MPIGSTTCLLFLGLSFNRPRFCPNASWNPNATTFADSSTIGFYPQDIFISINNTVYATSYGNSRAVVWNAGSSVPIRTISSNLTNPTGLFVTTAGDTYIDAGGSTGRIDKWTWNSTSGIPVMYTCSKCSIPFQKHIVVKKGCSNGRSSWMTRGKSRSVGRSVNYTVKQRYLYWIVLISQSLHEGCYNTKAEANDILIILIVIIQSEKPRGGLRCNSQSICKICSFPTSVRKSESLVLYYWFHLWAGVRESILVQTTRWRHWWERHRLRHHLHSSVA